MRKDMAVVSFDGLVGRILEVGPETSRVILLTDLDARVTLEELLFDAKGRLLSDSLTNYKVPDLHFAPREIEVVFLEDAGNPRAIMHSKAIGEPPTGLSAGEGPAPSAPEIANTQAMERLKAIYENTADSVGKAEATIIYESAVIHLC